MMSSLITQANIYTILAHSLAISDLTNIPAWLVKPGREWPLYSMVQEMADGDKSNAWGKAVSAIERVKTASSIETRLAEYRALFVGSGRPSIWLYESHHTNGRIPGPATFQVKKLYAQAGLESDSAELPDHAALELAFLVYLSEQASKANSSVEDWLAVRDLFINNHAGFWLPTVGQQLIRSQHPAWVAIGYTLIASLTKAKRIAKKNNLQVAYPVIAQEEDCTLCGFCVQICPEQALKINEDEQNTELWLIPQNCTSCHKCETVCDSNALTLSTNIITSTIRLRQSERAICPACNARTVSKAELKTVVMMLGEQPAWLDYCLNCRPQHIGMN